MPKKQEKSHYRVYESNKNGDVGKKIAERSVRAPSAALNVVYKGKRSTNKSPKWVIVEELKPGPGMGKMKLYQVRKEKKQPSAYLKEAREDRGEKKGFSKPYYAAKIISSEVLKNE